MADTDIVELIGVYHANGSLVGELTYVVKRALGRGHCALCDITHGPLTEKAAWKSCRSRLEVPITTVHLDERGPDVAAVSEGRTPCVVGRTGSGEVVMVATAADLDACAGQPDSLVDLLEQRLAR